MRSVYIQYALSARSLAKRTEGMQESQGEFCGCQWEKEQSMGP